MWPRIGDPWCTGSSIRSDVTPARILACKSFPSFCGTRSLALRLCHHWAIINPLRIHRPYLCNDIFNIILAYTLPWNKRYSTNDNGKCSLCKVMSVTVHWPWRCMAVCEWTNGCNTTWPGGGGRTAVFLRCLATPPHTGKEKLRRQIFVKWRNYFVTSVEWGRRGGGTEWIVTAGNRALHNLNSLQIEFW